MLVRMYYIVKIIKENMEPLNGQSIKEALERYNISVDVKTVQKSIIKINEMTRVALGYDLVYNLKKRGYCIKNNYFSDGQIQFLLDVVLSNDNLSQDSKTQLESKLKFLASENQLASLNFTNKASGNLDYDLLLNLSTIIKAINNKKNIIFKYITYDVVDNKLNIMENKGGNCTVNGNNYYMISPYRLVMDNSNYYVLGHYDQRSDSMSVYRVDRMRLVQTYKGRFVKEPKEQIIDNYLKNNVNMYISSSSSSLEFIFTNKVIREIGAKFGDDLWVEKVGDKYRGIIHDVNINDGLIGWIMMLNSEIEIVKPASLKQQIREKVAVLTNIYK